MFGGGMVWGSGGSYGMGTQMGGVGNYSVSSYGTYGSGVSGYNGFGQTVFASPSHNYSASQSHYNNPTEANVQRKGLPAAPSPSSKPKAQPKAPTNPTPTSPRQPQPLSARNSMTTQAKPLAPSQGLVNSFSSFGEGWQRAAQQGIRNGTYSRSSYSSYAPPSATAYQSQHASTGNNSYGTDRTGSFTRQFSGWSSYYNGYGMPASYSASSPRPPAPEQPQPQPQAKQSPPQPKQQQPTVSTVYGSPPAYTPRRGVPSPTYTWGPPPSLAHTQAPSGPQTPRNTGPGPAIQSSERKAVSIPSSGQKLPPAVTTPKPKSPAPPVRPQIISPGAGAGAGATGRPLNTTPRQLAPPSPSPARPAVPAEHDKESLSLLSGMLQGVVLVPGTPEFSASLTSSSGNQYARQQPTLIIEAMGSRDVANAVKYAARSLCSLAIASGRQSQAWAGRRGGAVLIDLVRMSGVNFDQETGLVDIQAGARMSTINQKMAGTGYSVVCSPMSSTGVGGFAMAGGYGLLSRQRGLFIDSLSVVEMVDLQGTVIEVSDESHPDLFWGVRGGGGNFSIATRFTVKAWPVELVWIARLSWDIDQVSQVLRVLGQGDFAGQLPPNLNATFTLRRDEKGSTFTGSLICFPSPSVTCESSLAEEGKNGFASLLEATVPKTNESGVVPFAEVETLAQSSSKGHTFERGYYFENKKVESVAEILKAHCEVSRTNDFEAKMFLGGGKIREANPLKTAFPCREFDVWLNFTQSAGSDREASQVAAQFAPLYAKYCICEQQCPREEGIKTEVHWGGKAPQLQRLKADWDPVNALCHNCNISSVTSPASPNGSPGSGSPSPRRA